MSPLPPPAAPPPPPPPPLPPAAPPAQRIPWTYLAIGGALLAILVAVPLLLPKEKVDPLDTARAQVKRIERSLSLSKLGKLNDQAVVLALREQGQTLRARASLTVEESEMIARAQEFLRRRLVLLQAKTTFDEVARQAEKLAEEEAKKKSSR